MKRINFFKYFSIVSICLWLFVFALFAFMLTLLASFMMQDSTHLMYLPFTLSNYSDLFHSFYVKIFYRSLYLAGLSTLWCLVLAYPFAYILAKMDSWLKDLLLLLLIIPFWTSSLIRSYAMIAIIKTKGILNVFLLSIGLIHQPLQILFTNTAVMIGLVYNLLPFMILPLYANIERLDHRLVEAAKDLGASNFTTFSRVIIPLTIPGIVAGCILVLLPAMTLFYIPDLLGGSKSLLLGNLIQYQFLTAHNWPQGAAISVVLTILMGVLLSLYWLSAKNKGAQDFL